jgi:hypothetical protein
MGDWKEMSRMKVPMTQRESRFLKWRQSRDQEPGIDKTIQVL